MELEHAAATSGRTTRGTLREWAQRARELGPGLVKVADNTWAMTTKRGVEVWNREPSPAEMRASIGNDAPIATRAPAAYVPAKPRSANAKRVAALFGGRR